MKTLPEIMREELDIPRELRPEGFKNFSLELVPLSSIQKVAERYADQEVKRETALIEKRIRKELQETINKFIKENL